MSKIITTTISKPVFEMVYGLSAHLDERHRATLKRITSEPNGSDSTLAITGSDDDMSSLSGLISSVAAMMADAGLADQARAIYESSQAVGEAILESTVTNEQDAYAEKSWLFWFEVFWDKYPKKVGKPDARKAFKAAKLDFFDFHEMMDRLEATEKGRRWRTMRSAEKAEYCKFIPNPATYLRQRRWEGDLMSWEWLGEDRAEPAKAKAGSSLIDKIKGKS